MLDIATFQDLVVAAMWLVPLVTGITEVIKRALSLSAQFIPLAAVIVGVVTGLFLVQFSVPGAFVGIVLGLGSIGLWEVGKTTVLGK